MSGRKEGRLWWRFEYLLYNKVKFSLYIYYIVGNICFNCAGDLSEIA